MTEIAELERRISFALERIGHQNWSVYDGAWAEWGMYNDLRVATGEA